MNPKLIKWFNPRIYNAMYKGKRIEIYGECKGGYFYRVAGYINPLWKRTHGYEARQLDIPEWHGTTIKIIVKKSHNMKTAQQACEDFANIKKVDAENASKPIQTPGEPDSPRMM